MDPDLARELREAGLGEAEAAELADLAAELGPPPAAEPRRTWLQQSKWRLLRAFDARRAAQTGADDAGDAPD